MGATSSKSSPSPPSPDRVLQRMSGDVWAHADRLVDCFVAERFGGRVAMRARFGGQPLGVLTFWADAVRWTHRSPSTRTSAPFAEETADRLLQAAGQLLPFDNVGIANEDEDGLDQMSLLESALRHRVESALLSLSTACDPDSLVLWLQLATLHVSALLLRPRPRTRLAATDVIALVARYRAEVNSLRATLKLRLQSSYLRLVLRERSYFTFPLSDEKRWWADALVHVREASTPAFRSSEHKVAHVCLTYGFPPSHDYLLGMAKDPRYMSLWDCDACDMFVCNDTFACVKCVFADRLADIIVEEGQSLLRFVERLAVEVISFSYN